MKNKLTQFVKKNTSPPIAFIVFIIFAYGILTPWMGFYWDDLPFAWFLHFFGPSDFIESFRPFRPILGYIFSMTTAVFGGHPFIWQLLGLLTRFILSYQVWSLTRKVLPNHQRSALWVTLIFTLYPAYGQQWVALTHVNQEFLPLIFLLSSFIITVDLIRNGGNSKPRILLALLLQCLCLFSTEYFFGLEILRPFFIYIILSETIKNRRDLAAKSIALWSPYLTVWITNAGWTYFYHRSDTYSSYQINFTSLLEPLTLINEFINTLSLSVFKSWLVAFNIFSPIDGSLTQLMAFGILIVTGTLAYLIAKKLEQGSILAQEGIDNSAWYLYMGIAAIFAGRLPSWAAGLPLKIEFDYDRFFISIMLGASFFIVGLANLLLKENKAKLVFLSLVIGLSSAFQFTAANSYRRDWKNTQDLFWQMSWRMPVLETGTTVLTYELPIQYLSDYQLMPALNWMYAPHLEGRELPYALQYLKTRFESFEIKNNQPIEITYRTTTFKGNTSQSVVIYKEANGCLRVLDPIYNNAETIPGASFYLIDAIPLSNPSLILSNVPTSEMDKTLFGEEPSHGWCYIYAKAEIARQAGDWKEVTKLYKDAQKAEIFPSLPVEYLPFIEAFATTDDLDTAIKLTERTIKGQPTLCPALHTLWGRMSSETDISKAESLLKKECK